MAYTIRDLAPDDAGMLEAYLKPRTEYAYFLRSNAARAGIIWQGQPYQAEYLGVFDGDQMVGVVAYTWMNTILLDALDPVCVSLMLPWLRDRLAARGGKIEAITACSALVQRVIDGLPLAPDDLRLNKDEGLFQKLIPETGGAVLPSGLSVRRADAADIQLIAGWRSDFNVEAVGRTRTPEMYHEAEQEIARRIDEGEIFILTDRAQPVSFCGSSGNLPDAMWIGPVWTPVDLRNRGYARHVVAGCVDLVASERPALAQAALIAGNPAAIRAYEAVGFRQIAAWRLAFCQENFVWQKKNEKK